MILNRKKRRLSGFTLVEVMTSLVIVSILIAVSSAVIITTFNIFAEDTMMRDAQNNGNNIYNFLYDRISYATALKISENADNINEDYAGRDSDIFTRKNSLGTADSNGSLNIADYYEQITVDKNFMKINRKTVSGDVYVYGTSDNESNKNTLNGCDCIVEFFNYREHDKSNTVKLRVTLSRDGKDLYVKEGTIPLLNRKLMFTASDPNRKVVIGEEDKIQYEGLDYEGHKTPENEKADASYVIIDNRSSDINIIYTYVQ